MLSGSCLVSERTEDQFTLWPTPCGASSSPRNGFAVIAGGASTCEPRRMRVRRPRSILRDAAERPLLRMTRISRRCRLLCQIAIVDIADRDRAAGECATEAVGEFQRYEGVKRRIDRLQIILADSRSRPPRGKFNARGADHVAGSLETEAPRHLHAGFG